MSSPLANELLWTALALEGGHLQAADVMNVLRSRSKENAPEWTGRLPVSAGARQLLDQLVRDKSCFLPELSEGSVSDTDQDSAWPPPPAPLAGEPPTPVNLVGLATPEAPLATAPPGRFQRLAVHAEGGIGRVWRTKDTILDRELALKELHPGKENIPTLRQYFLQEARLTGQLEHPGIVPVHDLLTDGPGQPPYYLMRLLQGRTLFAAVREYHQKRIAGAATVVERSQLLSAFVQVCQTVAFAHARCVLHRDLKGTNIHLGDFGEVVVLDWGLACRMQNAKCRSQKLEGGRQEEYAEGNQGHHGEGIVGTPAYMAPEQAEGRSDLGPAADVFALGAVLHEILTGKPPQYESLQRLQNAPVADLLKAKLTEEVLSPRVLLKDIPPALEAVCRKALARQVKDRYGSAADLARDMQAFLADEPVTAHQEPWTARLGRWGRKHRSLVTGLAALVVAGLVGLGITTVLVSQEQQRTEAAAERASSHFRQAREAVDLFFVKVSEDRLLQESGLQPLRQDLLQVAQGYYERFLQQDAKDPRLRQDLAGTLFRLAAVSRELGDTGLARKQLEEALTLYRDLNEKEPGEWRHQFHLALVWNRLGFFEETAGQAKTAEAFFRLALPLLQQLVKEHSPSDEARKYLGYCQGNLGMLLLRQGALNEAEDLLRQSLDHQERRASVAPHDPQRQDDLAAAHTNLAVLLTQRQMKDEALAEMRKALRIHQDLAKEHPRAVAYRRHLSKSWNNIGGLLGPTAPGEEALREALKLREQIAAGNPLVGDYQRDLAEMWQSLGVHYYKRRAGAANDQGLREKMVAQSEEAFKKAQSQFAELAKASPDTIVFPTGQGIALASLGDLWAEEKKPGASNLYRQAHGFLKKAVDQGYHDPQAKHYLRNCAWGLAEEADAAKNWVAALGYWLDALRIDAREPALRDGALRTLTQARASGFFELPEDRKLLTPLQEILGLSNPP